MNPSAPKRTRVAEPYKPLLCQCGKAFNNIGQMNWHLNNSVAHNPDKSKRKVNLKSQLYGIASKIAATSILPAAPFSVCNSGSASGHDSDSDFSDTDNITINSPSLVDPSTPIATLQPNSPSSSPNTDPITQPIASDPITQPIAPPSSIQPIISTPNTACSAPVTPPLNKPQPTSATETREQRKKRLYEEDFANTMFFYNETAKNTRFADRKFLRGKKLVIPCQPRTNQPNGPLNGDLPGLLVSDIKIITTGHNPAGKDPAYTAQNEDKTTVAINTEVLESKEWSGYTEKQVRHLTKEQLLYFTMNKIANYYVPLKKILFQLGADYCPVAGFPAQKFRAVHLDLYGWATDQWALKDPPPPKPDKLRCYEPLSDAQKRNKAVNDFIGYIDSVSIPLYQKRISQLQPDIVLMSLTAEREVKATAVWKKLKDWRQLSFLKKNVKSYQVMYCVVELETGHQTLFFNSPPQQVAYGGLNTMELAYLGERMRNKCIRWGKKL